MIKYIDGDLLKISDDFEVICHCANCFCVMGSGIAPLIKAKFSEAYEVDCATKKGDINKLGSISYTENTVPTIVNLYGQFGFGGRQIGEMDLDYKALQSALRLMKGKFTGKKFGLNRIGCGLAGGSWDIVEKIIEKELEGEDVTVVNYVPSSNS